MLRHRWLDRSAEERIHLHVLAQPLRGSGFALGQPDRLRRQAHLELRLADVAAPFFSFPFPFSLKGVKGEVLFSPSLFFDFADGDPPPVDNSSVFIGFSFRVFVVCVSPRFGSRSARRVRFPMGREPPQGAVIPDRGKSNICHQVKTKQKRPSGTKPEGLEKA